MTRDELLAAVIAERQDCRWFPTPPKTAADYDVARDDDGWRWATRLPAAGSVGAGSRCGRRAHEVRMVQRPDRRTTAARVVPVDGVSMRVSWCREPSSRAGFGGFGHPEWGRFGVR